MQVGVTTAQELRQLAGTALEIPHQGERFLLNRIRQEPPQFGDHLIDADAPEIPFTGDVLAERAPDLLHQFGGLPSFRRRHCRPPLLIECRRLCSRLLQRLHQAVVIRLQGTEARRQCSRLCGCRVRFGDGCGGFGGGRA